MVSDSGPAVVLVDTNVWSCVSGDKRHPDQELVQAWKRFLTGKVIVIATQTRAEILQGLRFLGPRRASILTAALDRTRCMPVTEEVVQAYATLYYEAMKAGHPIHNKIHAADRWIAATAIALGIPLLTEDHMFWGAPQLTLIPIT
ncbi:MAG: PIN domain-containing protein [Bifidobacteriaceae bacterium]|jgi:predicted nucleic acid-binding protein|nr:PIN domain-containing protein [Bifidobacteriaceae bacterium]